MREFNYSLSTKKIESAKPKEKPYPLTDGGGLFVEVLPSGKKIWRYSYRYQGKRSKVTIGAFPAVGMKEARDAHERYRKVLVDGSDPAQVKRLEKLGAPRAVSFQSFSELWIRETLFYRGESTRAQQVAWLQKHVFPRIGLLSIDEVRPAHILEIIESLRDKPSTANMLRGVLQQIFNYAIRKLLVVTNPAIAVRGAVPMPEVKHYRPLTIKEIPLFMHLVEEVGAHVSTKWAVRLLMLAVVRKANVCMARKEHFDLEKNEWNIPARRGGGDGSMKMRRAHRVYLSRQARQIVDMAWELSGDSPWLFPSIYKSKQPMGHGTINSFFTRLYASGLADDFKPHGLRSTASTHMNEAGHIRADVIEKIMAHEQEGVRGVYNVAEYAAERAQALQWYADYIDRLCSAEVQMEEIQAEKAA